MSRLSGGVYISFGRWIWTQGFAGWDAVGGMDDMMKMRKRNFWRRFRWLLLLDITWRICTSARIPHGWHSSVTCMFDCHRYRKLFLLVWLLSRHGIRYHVSYVCEGGRVCIFPRCTRNTAFISWDRCASSFLAASEKTSSMIPQRSGFEDIFYCIKRASGSFPGFHLIHFCGYCPVNKHEFFILKHSLVGKNGLSNHLGLVYPFSMILFIAAS
jgi:hypothetical protein